MALSTVPTVGHVLFAHVHNWPSVSWQRSSRNAAASPQMQQVGNALERQLLVKVVSTINAHVQLLESCLDTFAKAPPPPATTYCHHNALHYWMYGLFYVNKQQLNLLIYYSF